MSHADMDVYLEKCRDLIDWNGVSFDRTLKLRKLIVTGPPCAGKSTFLRQIGGWPLEGYLDLSSSWWKSSALNYRPREAHLCLPFHGFDQDMTVFDPLWLDQTPPPRPDFSRIRIPPTKQGFFSLNWRDRVCFDFLIPSPEITFRQTRERALKGTHHVDREATLERVTLQTEIFFSIARFFHEQGLQVYVRDGVEEPPQTFCGGAS